MGITNLFFIKLLQESSDIRGNSRQKEKKLMFKQQDNLNWRKVNKMHNIFLIRDTLAEASKKDKMEASKRKTQIFLEALLKGTHLAIVENILRNFS